jgi:hypothetical protein
MSAFALNILSVNRFDNRSDKNNMKIVRIGKYTGIIVYIGFKHKGDLS